MNQLIPTPLALIFVAVLAWGVGTFLLRFNEKLMIEIEQNNVYYQDMINSQSFEMRKNRKVPAIDNQSKIEYNKQLR